MTAAQVGPRLNEILGITNCSIDFKAKPLPLIKFRHSIDKWNEFQENTLKRR